MGPLSPAAGTPRRAFPTEAFCSKSVLLCQTKTSLPATSLPRFTLHRPGWCWPSPAGEAERSVPWEVPGASRTVLEAIVPYSEGSLVRWLGGPPDRACSPPTARAMAMAAYCRAREYQRTAGVAAGANGCDSVSPGGHAGVTMFRWPGSPRRRVWQRPAQARPASRTFWPPRPRPRRSPGRWNWPKAAAAERKKTSSSPGSC